MLIKTIGLISRSQVVYYTEVAISSAWLAAAFVAICPASQLVRAGRRAAELSWSGPPLWLRQEDALEAIAHGCVGRGPSSVWVAGRGICGRGLSF
jgi:hypothetical protein